MFKDPIALAWMLPALLALGLLAALGSRRRAGLTSLFGDPRTLSRLLPPERGPRRSLKSLLQAASLALLFIALAGPQWGVEMVATQAKTHQAFLAVDTSLSMNAEDVKPTRLEKAKRELSLLLEELRGNRVGVIAFAGEAAVVCPLTMDVEAARQILRSLEPGMVPVPGTAIGKAVRLSARSLQRYPGAKSLVLLTDGEDHRSDPLGAAEEAAAMGLKIFAIGLGTPEGEPIPVRDSSGSLTGYKKGPQGATVISRLGEGTLAAMAQRTGGAYFRSTPQENEALEIAERILRGEKAQAVASRAARFRNRFQWPLALGFLILLLELLIPETGRKAPSGKASKVPAALAGLILLLAAPLYAATAEGALRRGNRLYRKGDFAQALESYAEAGRRRPKDPRPLFNAGDALYRLDRYDQAGQAFGAAAESSKGKKSLRADSHYNLGNSRFQSGDYREAVAHYREALRLDPKDPDARHNLAVALRMLKTPPQPSQRPQEKQKEKPQERKGQGGSGERPSQPPQPKPRPQDQLSREDAERILRAVAEKERLSPRQVRKESRKPENEEDW